MKYATVDTIIDEYINKKGISLNTVNYTLKSRAASSLWYYLNKSFPSFSIYRESSIIKKMPNGSYEDRLYAEVLFPAWFSCQDTRFGQLIEKGYEIKCEEYDSLNYWLVTDTDSDSAIARYFLNRPGWGIPTRISN